MIGLDNALGRAWEAAGAVGAQDWDEIAEEIASVRPKDVEETLRWLSGLDPGDVDRQAVTLAAFCYGACAGPLRVREDLLARAGRVCQEVFVAGGGDAVSAEFVFEAAEKFPLRSFRDRYQVARQIAQASWHDATLRQKAVEKQLQWARSVCDLDKTAWPTLVDSLLAVAGLYAAAGNYGLERRSLGEAASIAGARATHECAGEALVAGGVLSRLGMCLRALGQNDTAAERLEEAERWLSAAAAQGIVEASRALIPVYLALGESADEAGAPSRARDYVGKAAAEIDRLGEPRPQSWFVPARLASLIEKSAGEKSADEFRRDVLERYGTRAAAFAGDPAATELMEVLWEGQVKGDIPGQPSKLAPASCQEWALRMLNLQPELVERRIEEVAREWEAATRDRGPVSLPGVSNVGRYRQELERWQAVRILQKIAESATADREHGGDEVCRVGQQARLRGFTVADLKALFSVRGRALRVGNLIVQAGAADATEGSLNFSMPDEDYYHPLPDDHAVDLVLRREVVRGVETSHMDVWIDWALQLLTDTLLSNASCLRRCHMPRGVAAYLKYRLAEGERPEECGRYYIPQRRNKRTCGNHTCETYHGQITSYARLSEEAQAIAEREWRNAAYRHLFPAAWAAASNGRSPKEALAQSRKQLAALTNRET